MRLPLAAFLLALLVVALSAPAVQAQPASAPQVAAADEAFDRGLRLYTSGQYREAHEAFRRAAEQYDFHQRTTAAHLMAGKALFAAGSLDEAASAMTRLISAYPNSRYVAEARSVRRDALAARDRVPSAAPVRSLGVILPLGAEDAVFTQALFNGLRLAVDEHNASQPQQPVRMVFRDTRGSGIDAAEAVAALQQAGAAVVLGPLYSEEAVSAGAAAERLGVTLVAPLATDGRVSDGRRYVFQANPTFEMRGRAMGRFAADRRLGSLGIVAVRGTYAEAMGEAFASEVVRRGQPAAFFERLPSEEAWFQLGERVGAARLRSVDALYLPVAGAEEQATAALRGLSQALEGGGGPRVLGNAGWGSAAGAGRQEVLYTSDFYLAPETPARRDFTSRYRALAGTDPDRLAYLGYDLGRMLLGALADRRGDEPFADTLRRARPFAGLGHRLDFAGGQVNEALFLLALSERGVVLVE